jgi:Na+/proline symporter
MKSTKIMLAVIATLISTWTLMSLIGWVLSDTPLRECYTHGGILMLMLIFGWIPAVIIGADLNEQLEN